MSQLQQAATTGVRRRQRETVARRPQPWRNDGKRFLDDSARQGDRWSMLSTTETFYGEI